MIAERGRRVVLAVSLFSNVTLLGMVGLLLLSPREGRLRKQLANHQAVLNALVASGAFSETQLEQPLATARSGPAEAWGDGRRAWLIDVDVPPNTTELEEVQLVFDAHGRLEFAGPYKP